MQMGDQRSCQSFLTAIRGPLSAKKALQGGGIRILTPTFSSPTLADQLRNFLKIYPQAKWHVYEPINRDNVLEGAKLAFGQPVETRYDFEKADIIVSLDADFLYAGFPGNVRYIRDFARRRSQPLMDSDKLEDRSSHNEMNRLYVIESTPTTTGAKADHRFPVRAGKVEILASDLAIQSGPHADFIPVGGIGPGKVKGGDYGWLVSAAARDLQGHPGSSIVLVGDHQPPAVHALAHTMNAKLGHVGKTGFYSDAANANSGQLTDS